MDRQKPLNKPEAIVIGAMRAGTTALYQTFKAASMVAVPEVKETDFYLTESHFRNGPGWYARQFKQADMIWVDFCPNYSKRHIFPSVSRRIVENCPNTKIVYLVRDPVERAISHYKHSFYHNGNFPMPHELFSTREGRNLIDVSRYAYQIEPYLDQWDKDDVLVVSFEDLVGENSADALASIVTHIGLVEERELEGAGLEKKNSAEAISRMPKWWNMTRNSRLGNFIRFNTPRGLVERVRPMFKMKQSTEQVPEFDPDTLKRLEDLLRPDAEEFRKRVKQPYGHWRV